MPKLEVLPQPYEDRSAAAEMEANLARLPDDAKKFVDFKNETCGIEKHFVRAANLGREIGLSFRAYYLPARKELAEGWFNAHYRKALGMNYDQFQWFIAISRKLPEECICMADVMPVQQLSLFAGELIALPERAHAQVSHETTPYTYFFDHLRGLRTDLEKRLADADEWDQDTKIQIKGEIERAEAFLAEAKRKLV